MKADKETEDLLNYLLSVIGRLVRELTDCKHMTDDAAKELFTIISDGIKEIELSYKNQNSAVDETA